MEYELSVVGWGTGEWMEDKHVVLVRLGGRGPKGKLRGFGRYSPERSTVRLCGDRGSCSTAKQGIRSISWRGTDVPGLFEVIKKIAVAWITENPNALDEYKAASREQLIAHLRARVERAKEQLAKDEAALANALDAQ